jgi:N-acetylglucosamine malate deacetylase 2
MWLTMTSNGNSRPFLVASESRLQPLEQKSRTTLVLAAHPDDEVIGATSVLTSTGSAAYVVFLTDGAPLDSALWSSHQDLSRSDYATLRWREAVAALTLAGVPKEKIFCLGSVDQESAQALPLLVRRFVTVVADVRPELVITHAYEGGHPDHDSAALVAYAATATAQSSPELWEMTSYHGANGTFRCAQFIRSTGADPHELTIELSPEQREIKSEMLLCYESQRSVLQAFVASADVERFRPAPDYDFAMPPHPGTLWYETQGWAMTGSEWRRLASFFLEQQGLSRPNLRCA